MLYIFIECQTLQFGFKSVELKLLFLRTSFAPKNVHRSHVYKQAPHPNPNLIRTSNLEDHRKIMSTRLMMQAFMKGLSKGQHCQKRSIFKFSHVYLLGNYAQSMQATKSAIHEPELVKQTIHESFDTHGPDSLEHKHVELLIKLSETKAEMDILAKVMNTSIAAKPFLHDFLKLCYINNDAETAKEVFKHIEEPNVETRL